MEWLDFSFHNISEHRRIADAIQATYSQTVPVLAIDPIPVPYDDWLEKHYEMHSQAADITGTVNYDLRDVDFSSPGDLQSWIQLHYQQHLDLNRALGL